MEHFKPLHVANNLQELNQNINKNFNWKKVPRPKDAARKLYQESQIDPLDEERTYILLSRFLRLYNFLIETSHDRGQIESLLGKDANKALIQLATVKSNLIKRYEDKEKKEDQAQCSNAPSEKLETHDMVFKNKENQFINCADLHNALKSSNLLIMDVRDVAEFKASRIKNAMSINIPENLIQSGLSAHTLGNTLPKESLEHWEKRDSFDVIVLMDWYTNNTTYTASRLDKLRTILLEWDIGRTYNEPPVILNNGYGEFLDMYPTQCTSSNIRYLKANAELDELLTLDSIEYPQDASSKLVELKSEVTSDEALKLAENVDELSIEEKELSCITFSDNDEEPKPITEVPPPPPPPQDKRQLLLDKARSEKKPDFKPADKPIVDRGTKPKVRAIPFEVNSDVREQGLTGLVNIKNTCYLNTVIQCMRHIPEVYKFYFVDKNENAFRQPCAISVEMENLVRALWNNNSFLIKPIEFYNKFTILAPPYKEGHHEDCMEFFISLFTFLSEDCAYEVTAKNTSCDADRAWHTQHNGKLSYFIDKFYYQLKLTHDCTCRNRNVKYEIENVFYLTIPNANFYLEDCMTAYLRQVDLLKCKKCGNIDSVTRSVYRYPKVLVIALKRHVQVVTCTTSIPIFKKNENRCFFPEKFKMDRVTYYLKAVAMHNGTTDSGHYTAACLNPYNKEWYLFNDDTVMPIKIHQKSVGIKAYAFFYSITE